MKKYDWKTIKLISVTWGVIVFPLSFLTIFYYLFLYLISALLFGEMNLYFQGILAGGTGGIWSYFVAKGIDKQVEIAKDISSYSKQKYYHLLKKRAKTSMIFLFFTIVEVIFIRIFHFY